MKALRQCDCTGDQNLWLIVSIPLSKKLAKDYYVECAHCGAKSKVAKTEKQAIRFWERGMGPGDIRADRSRHVKD